MNWTKTDKAVDIDDEIFFLNYKMNVYTVGLKKEYSIIPLATILRDLLIYILILTHSEWNRITRTHTYTQ